jgi:hypothetical protein
MRVSAFVAAYAKAFSQGDAEAVADFYDVPLAVVRPDRTVLVPDRDRLAAELRRIGDTYRWSGMRRAEPWDVEEVGFQESLGIVNVTWRLLDAEDAPITAIASTYLLRRRGDRMLIAGIVAHDEEARRAPLVEGDALRFRSGRREP